METEPKRAAAETKKCEVEEKMAAQNEVKELAVVQKWRTVEDK